MNRSPAGPLSPSLEDYLEAIFVLLQGQPEAHAAKIADRLGVRRASVTGALRQLSDKGLIHYQPYKGVTLTPEGRALGSAVAARHQTLTSFLTGILGMEAQEAEAAACGMEHGTSPAFMNRLVEFLNFFEECDEVKIQWSQKGKVHCGHPKDTRACRLCQRHAEEGPVGD